MDNKEETGNKKADRPSQPSGRPSEDKGKTDQPSEATEDRDKKGKSIKGKS